MKPILFNTAMVRAILDGRKTVTRRLVRPASLIGLRDEYRAHFEGYTDEEIVNLSAKPYYPGDVLYVRETWAEWDGGYVYKEAGAISAYPASFVDCWRPSIHMPKEAARIFLRVTAVRAERLQSMREDDARKEGSPMRPIAREIWSYRKGFQGLWDSTIKPADRPLYGWDANPWVWVIEFERCERPEVPNA